MKPLVLGVVLGGLLFASAYAQSPQASVPQAKPSALLTQPLTLQVFLKQVVQTHPKLLGADIERRIAAAKLLEKQGAFDPGIGLETDYLRYNDFSNKGKVSTAWDNDLALQWQSPLGLKLSTGARYNTGSIKPPLYPTGEGGEYFMGVKMPLLRGFRLNDKSVALRQAEIGIPYADMVYRQTQINVLLQATHAYWAWTAAVQKVNVAQALLNIAKTRNEATQQRVDQGDLPRIDAIETAQEVQRRQGLLAKAQRDYEKQAYKLSQYWWADDGHPLPLPNPGQVPLPSPMPTSLTDDDWMEARRVALESRPELKSLKLQQEMTEVDLDFAKNQRLPILDLFAFPGVDTGEKSVGSTLKAGVSLWVPLRQRTAKGLVRAARFKLQKLDMDQRLLLQQVLLDVDDAYSATQAAYQQYQAAVAEQQLALQLEQGERDRFDAGDSTLFLLNQRERGRAEAAQKVLDLLAEYHQSVASLKAASGKL